MAKQMIGNQSMSLKPSRLYHISILGANVTGIVAFALFADAITEGVPVHKHYGDFGFHPLMMTLAFALFGVLAALSFRTCEHLLGLSHQAAKYVHAALNSVALSIALVGVASMWKTHSGQTHFQSVHSWIGIVVISLFMAQAFFGIVIFFFGSSLLRSRFVESHRLAGIMLVTLTLGTLVTGTFSMVQRVTLTSFSAAVYNKMNSAACLAVLTALEIAFVFSYGPLNSEKFKKQS